MRKLTIKRNKSFVGCAGKFKVYIEDPEINEININNVPCRKICELKNGEEKTVYINEHAAKVFVIADKLSKNYCNDYYQIPPGSEDVYLSGKSKYNPAVGNAFRFDNNNNQGALANRKRGMRKGCLIFLIVLIVSSIIGLIIGASLFPEENANRKTFSAYGMTITLTEAFSEIDVPNFTAAYESNNVAVCALKEPFTLFHGFSSYTLEEYGNEVIKTNRLTSVELKEADGLTYFMYDYKDPQTRKNYTYFAFVYKADDAFWLVQFATLTRKVNKHFEQIFYWAGSVEFAD
ncbi:MAG: hypothetical protein IKC48_00515 [Clostridia bacterium]|nr:hypothetical protein [Clostridia bacterium]